MSALTPYRSPLEKVCAVCTQGHARTAIVTLFEGVFKGAGGAAKVAGLTSLGGAFGNWVKMESLFFFPSSAVQWHQGRDWQYHKLNSLSCGLYGFSDLTRWGLRHAQITIRGAPIEGALELLENISSLGILVSSAFGIGKDLDALATIESNPPADTADIPTLQRRINLAIGIKAFTIVEVGLKLVAQKFKWYKTADVCVRVTIAALCLLSLWNSPNDLAATGGLFSSDDRGDGPDGESKGKKPGKLTARPTQARRPTDTGSNQTRQRASSVGGTPLDTSNLSESFVNVEDPGSK